MPTTLTVCPAEQVRPDCATLVEDHLPLMRRLVRERVMTLPRYVSQDELTSAAMMALVVSAQNFDPDRRVPFAHFAAIRIRGAILDELRGMDWAPRTVRARSREAESVRGRLTSVLERAPREAEVADAMKVTSRELSALNADVARARVLSLQAVASAAELDVAAAPSQSPEALLVMREELGYLHDAIAELPTRLRIVVNAYFFDERQMSDIAAELGLTQSRVSQLCSEALKLLRDGMNSQLAPESVSGCARTDRAEARRQTYFNAIAARGTLHSRLSRSTLLGDQAPLEGQLDAPLDAPQRSLIA